MTKSILVDSDPPPFRIQIPVGIRDAMVDYCVREAPQEACGLLGGVRPIVASLHPLRNASESEIRYDADPKDLIAAIQSLRFRGEEILAIYHSHPRWEAVPSKTDLRENHYGDVPRIIVSLLEGVPVVRVWRLDPESCQELRWDVIPDSTRDQDTSVS